MTRNFPDPQLGDSQYLWELIIEWNFKMVAAANNDNLQSNLKRLLINHC